MPAEVSAGAVRARLAKSARDELAAGVRVEDLTVGRLGLVAVVGRYDEVGFTRARRDRAIGSCHASPLEPRRRRGHSKRSAYGGSVRSVEEAPVPSMIGAMRESGGVAPPS
jgi:hypothetical protein